MDGLNRVDVGQHVFEELGISQVEMQHVHTDRPQFMDAFENRRRAADQTGAITFVGIQMREWIVTTSPHADGAADGRLASLLKTFVETRQS